MNQREIKFRAWNERSEEMSSCDALTLAEFFEFNENRGRPIMQFTNLKDKNGKEIYEGDIVQRLWSDGTIKNQFEVKWLNMESGWNLSEQLLDALPKMQNTWEPGFEVIGNIYENPELLTN